MAHLYYGNDLTLSQLSVGHTVTITGDEARHAVRVSRLRVGETIQIGNGAGVFARGEVLTTERDHFSVRIAAVETHEPAPTRLVLIQALAKGDRDERAVEQSTEFGVDSIIPWEADRSVSRWGREKSVKGTEKWQRIAREAAKQSVRAWVPKVQDALTSSEVAQLAAEPNAAVLVLHPRGTSRLSEWCTESLSAQLQTIYLVVGPEGGISENELERFTAAGAQPVLLGNTVLRTSSAGPAALAICNVALGRW